MLRKFRRRRRQKLQQLKSAAGQTQAAGQATMMEPQTYENDANGNMIVPERQAGSMEGEPAWRCTGKDWR